MNNPRSFARFAGFIGATALLPIGFAIAQQVPAQNTASSAGDELQEIVITGTAIRGVAPNGSELITYSRADIDLTSASTGTEILRSIPLMNSFNATGVNTGSNQANFVDQPAIHGIGVGNGGAGLTLILFDGHRLPGAGINQTAPDAGVIPASVIERVEVMADGGSSIYGSDAVSGVINFVTRRHFDGAETTAQTGWADGYQDDHFSQLFGKTWSSGSLLLDYEYIANSALNGTSRAYAVNDQTPWGGPDSRSTTCTPGNVSAGGLSFAISPTGAPVLGTTNKCESNHANDMYPGQHRNQFYAAVHQQIGDNVDLYANTVYSGRTMNDHVSGSGVTTGGLSVTVPSTSPYYLTLPGVPAGTPESVTYNPAADFGPTFTNRITTTTSSSVVGANITLPNRWQALIEVNYGLEHDDVRSAGINQGAANDAAAAGTFNPYGVGPATNAAVLASIGDFITRYYGVQTLKEAQAKFDGPIFAMGGGDAKAAIGVDTRKEEFDGLTSTGPSAGPATTYESVGSRSSYSGFTELFFPFVSASNHFVGVEKLDLSVSARYDHYSDVGSTTNPKLGLTWGIVDGVQLRASAGRSFHAPSLADAPTAIDTRTIQFSCIPGVFLGCNTATPADYTVIIAGGNKLKPETARTYNVGFDLTPALLEGFKASFTLFRVEYDNVITFPTFGPVTNPAAAYDQYRYLESSYTPAQWNTLATQLLSGYRQQGYVFPTNPQLPLAIYDLRRQNFADELINGFDYDINYTAHSSIGSWSTGVAGTQLMTFYQKIPGATAIVPLLDTDYAVRTRLRAHELWEQGSYSAALFLNYTGGYNNPNVTPSQRVSSFTTVDAHFAWKLPEEGILKGTVLSLDVQNLLDRDPPVFYTSGTNGIIGFDPTVANAFGRLISIGLRKSW